MSELGDKLISPNGFDGRGPVPEKVTEAGKRIGKHRVTFLLSGTLYADEIEELFQDAAVQAEWIRELYEAVHADA